MAKTKSEKRRVNEIVILILVVICILLIVVDVTANISAEISTQENQAAIKMVDEHLTPVPTLTEEQYQEMLNSESSGMQLEP